LLEAYARLRAELPECYPLVLVGGKGWLMDGLLAELEALALSRDVIYLGYVDDGSLTWLYENCFGFCYLSSFEGFGLPVIEAMSLGAPVVTTNATSVPEIVGSAGIMVDPHDVNQVYRAMLNLARESGLGESLRGQGLRRAAEFSWITAADHVRRIYHEVTNEPRATTAKALISSLVEDPA
jgi:glycosyltransferase involved in cell wall biosynthesis